MHRTSSHSRELSGLTCHGIEIEKFCNIATVELNHSCSMWVKVSHSLLPTWILYTFGFVHIFLEQWKLLQWALKPLQVFIGKDDKYKKFYSGMVLESKFYFLQLSSWCCVLSKHHTRYRGDKQDCYFVVNSSIYHDVIHSVFLIIFLAVKLTLSKLMLAIPAFF